MKLYHYPRSSASYRVRIALALKGLDWEPVTIHLGELQQYSEEYRRVAPSQAVPVLVDQGTTIAQSLAIIEYLDEMHPDRTLLPRAAAQRALARELALDIGCDIHPLNNTRVLRRLDGMGVSEPIRNEWYRHWIVTGLQVLEVKLDRAEFSWRFCLGDQPGVADCFLVPQIFNAKRFDCDLSPFVTVMKVFENCMALPAFRDTQPSAYEQPAIPGAKRA